ncbi:MAG: hypothetical protein AAGD43_30190, partial [Pseudomonadota bacterium]
MIGAFLVYGLVLFVATALFRSGRWLEFSIMAVPVLFCGYFLISVGIFSFGEDMPFTYYNPNRKEDYGYVSTMICLHYLTITAAFLFVTRFDKTRYQASRLQELKSVRLGTTGALFCVMPVPFILSAVSVSELWFRNSFQFSSDASGWLRFADLLVFLSAVLIPFIRNASLKYIVLAMVTVAFLAIGSRTAIAVLFVFSCMNLFVLERAKTWTSILLLFVTLWLLGTVLLLRAYNLGGISAVFEVALFGSYSDIIDRIIYGFNYNFNLSFILIAELLGSVKTSSTWFYYGIIPLPSAFFDQTSEYDALNRFRKNIPYSGLGYTLAYLGPLGYLAVVFLSSVAF